MKRVLIVSVILLSAGCSGSATPVAPAPPVVPNQTVSGVTVSSPNSMVFIGFTEQMSATTTLSNGTTQAAAGTWGSDSTSMATISSSGLVTGEGPGEATIYFDVTSGPRGTKRIRALPSYAGAWTGTYLVMTCTQSGAFVLANFCRDYADSLPFTLDLTQSQDQVTGTFLLGEIQFGRTTASVSLNGDLSLASTSATNSAKSISAILTISSALPLQWVGTVSHSWLGNQIGDAASVTGTITSASRRGLPPP
jgi:hypothetical protein